MRRALMILLLVAALVVGTAARDAPTGAAVRM